MSKKMYILIPDSFHISIQRQEFLEKEITILSSRTLKKGEQFLQYSGDWISVSNEIVNSSRQQRSLVPQKTGLNWLELLRGKKHDEKINACFKKANHQVILEILTEVQPKSQIFAADYSKYLAEKSVQKLDIDQVPLDLTWKRSSSMLEPPENIKNSLEYKSRLNSGKSRKLLQCDECKKYFDRPSLLKRHIRTHTGEKPHICDVCRKGFSTSSSLNTHRRIHSGERPHQCCVCGKRFTASSNLYYHKMTHNKEKPHKCQICNKSFPTPGNLKAHQYAHSGHWPFICKICGRGFGKQTNFRNHQILHSNQQI